MAQFDRIYKYKAIFRRKRFVTKQAFLEEFEISEATFKRDLDKMRDFYNYHIVYDRDENAYRLENEDQAYELPGLVFSQKELLGLLTIQNMITELEPGRTYTAVMRDISARVAAEARSRQSDRLAAMGTLAAGLGHDMNNMLLPVRAHLNALKANLFLSTNETDVLNAIDAGYPAAIVYPQSKNLAEQHPAMTS